MHQVSDMTEHAAQGAAPLDPITFEYAVVAAAAAEATPAQLEMLAANREPWRWTLERLLHRTDEDLDAVRSIQGPERDQIIADFEDERDRLEAALAQLTGPQGSTAEPILLESAGEVRLQTSWAAGRLVVWAAGPGTEPASVGGAPQASVPAGRPRERLDQPSPGAPAERRSSTCAGPSRR
ncbi:MAG: hypothetical protein V9E94_11735 [Microthrixaceae bacterium]